jgi:hypothetical protein
MKIISELLPILVDVDHHNLLVEQKVNQLLAVAVAGDPKPLLKFFGAYTSWNGYFAAGVTGLTAKITNARSMFMDPSAKYASVADRSSHIASFVFDAAREEYHDCNRGGRASHRALAQAFMIALTDALLPNQEAGSYNILLNEPNWLINMNRETPTHYLGDFKDSHNRFNVYAGIGYHIGSEWLADREFTIIDQLLAKHVPELRDKLRHARIEFMGRVHPGYAWITAHSGEGDAVEQEHYAMAVRAAELALEFTPEHDKEDAMTFLKLGIKQFADVHADFFKKNFLGTFMRPI